LAPLAEAWPWRFARCWMLATRFELHDGTLGDFDDAVAEFHQLPVDTPARARLAAILVHAQLRRGMLAPERMRQTVALADIANTGPAPLPEWPKTDAAVRATSVVFRVNGAQGNLSPLDGLAEIDRLAAVVGDEEPFSVLVEMARINVLYLKAAQEGDFGSMAEVAERSERLHRQHGESPMYGVHVMVLAHAMRVMLSLTRGDTPHMSRYTKEALMGLIFAATSTPTSRRTAPQQG
jgi:hypothetical protein